VFSGFGTKIFGPISSGIYVFGVVKIAEAFEILITGAAKSFLLTPLSKYLSQSKRDYHA